MTDAQHPDDDAALERTLRDSRRLEDAPEALIQRAIGLWQPRAAGAGRPRRLAATLSFDSAAAGAPALGLRSGAAATRQLLFCTEGRDVDLRLEPQTGGRWRVSGQVLGPDEAGEAELRPEVGAPQTVAWSELAEFAFAPVTGERCSVLLRAADWELELSIAFAGAAP